MERICVFCGASPGARPEYREATAELARLLAAEGIGVVYGGGGVGLMGALADAVIAEGGEVIGVIPRALVDREIAHRDVIDMRVVGSMHERKALMAELVRRVHRAARRASARSRSCSRSTPGRSSACTRSRARC